MYVTDKVELVLLVHVTAIVNFDKVELVLRSWKYDYFSGGQYILLTLIKQSWYYDVSGGQYLSDR